MLNVSPFTQNGLEIVRRPSDFGRTENQNIEPGGCRERVKTGQARTSRFVVGFDRSVIGLIVLVALVALVALVVGQGIFF